MAMRHDSFDLSKYKLKPEAAQGPSVKPDPRAPCVGITEVAELPASCAEIRSATKIRILLFSQSTVGYSPEEENRQLEKYCQVGLIPLTQRNGKVNRP